MTPCGQVFSSWYTFDFGGTVAATKRRFGVWRLAFGVWRLAFGVWRLAFGVWRSRRSRRSRRCRRFRRSRRSDKRQRRTTIVDSSRAPDLSDVAFLLDGTMADASAKSEAAHPPTPGVIKPNSFPLPYPLLRIGLQPFPQVIQRFAQFVFCCGKALWT